MRAHEHMPDEATREMCDTLKRLQTIKTHDYDTMYRETYGGIHVLNVNRVPSHARMIHGRNLAMRLRSQQSWNTRRLQDERNAG